MSPFMSVKQCAIYLRPDKPLHEQTLYRWAKRGKIPARKLNGMIVFHRDDIDEWTASKSTQPKQTSLSAFEQARLNVRSLKTEHTDRISRFQKGTR